MLPSWIPWAPSNCAADAVADTSNTHATLLCPRRAQTMVRTANFDAAATCFRKAGNSSRAQACQAQAKLQAAAEVRRRLVGPHERRLWLALVLLLGAYSL